MLFGKIFLPLLTTLLLDVLSLIGLELCGVGTLNGLYRYDGFNWSHYNSQNSILTNQINCITFDENNRLWVGTSSGLFSYDGKISALNLIALVLNQLL